MITLKIFWRKVQLPSQCKVRKWWSIDQDEWIIFFNFFRSHCQLEANPSSRTRIFDFNQINLYCLTSHGGSVKPLTEDINQDQSQFVVFVFVAYGPTRISVNIFSQITGNEVFNFISNFRRHWNKTRLIGNINWPGSGSGSGIWYRPIN